MSIQHQNLISTNKANWDDRAVFHRKQAETPTPTSYDLIEFCKGKDTLRSFETEAAGCVKEKKLLHLQCHIGMDTLSWARHGADVVGVDFSEKALAYARELARDLNLTAQFIESDVYSLPELCTDRFDIVYTSRGVLTWLPDLDAWAKVIAHFLGDGGMFIMHEEHPLTGCLSTLETSKDTELVVKHDYFNKEPARCEEGTYTGRDAVFEHSVSYQWQHTLGDIITSLIKAGLVLQKIEERPEGFYPCHSLMIKNENGDWVLPPPYNKVPLSYFLIAKKI